MTVNSKDLATLAAHYAASVEESTGTACEVLRTLDGNFCAVFAPIGRTVPLGATRDSAYATLAALLDVLDHTTPTTEATR